MPSANPARIGLLGCGTVGAATARILLDHADGLAARAGRPIELGAVAVRDPGRVRDVAISRDLLTTDAMEVVRGPEVEVVAELIGGMEPARTLVLEAIAAGKHVVTANKELIAGAGREILEAAEKAGVSVLFEASVAGGIPIIRPMKESLAGDRVRRVMGILNGTTNFILTRMSDTDERFEEALSEAASRGYTESDPSADIEGHDAAAKLAILASLAFNTTVAIEDVAREGISQVTPDDVRAAHDLGYEIKLVAVAEDSDGRIAARVHPAMLPRTHPLSSVRDEFNAVFIEAEEVGELMFFGRGAGGAATASAVVGDIVEVVRTAQSGTSVPEFAYHKSAATPMSAEDCAARYYMVLSVADQPGVLSAIAGVFGDNGVSIASVRQEGFGDEATLVLITHAATERKHSQTLAGLDGLPVVKSIDSTMRVLGTSEG